LSLKTRRERKGTKSVGGVFSDYGIQGHLPKHPGPTNIMSKKKENAGKGWEGDKTTKRRRKREEKPSELRVLVTTYQSGQSWGFGGVAVG